MENQKKGNFLQIYLEINGKTRKVFFKNKSIFYKYMYPIRIKEDMSFEDLKNRILERDRNKKIGQFVSPFSDDPLKIEEECEDFMKKIKKEEFLGKGGAGEVRTWSKSKGIAVKIESCNVFEMIRQTDPLRERTFLQLQEDNKKIVNYLADKGIAAQIYGVYKCGDNCITFMEKVEGETVEKYLTDFWNIIFKRHDIPLKYNPRIDFMNKDNITRPEPSMEEKKKIILLLKKIGNVIIKFHKEMEKIDHPNLGHGDLNLGNIMITPEGKVKLIDFAFENKQNFREDWDHFLGIFGLYTDYNFNEITIKKLERHGLDEEYYPISENEEKIWNFLFQNKKQKYYYHGSRTEIEDYLEPRPSRVINNEKAVFASNSKDIAIAFIPGWKDEDFEFGRRSNEEKYKMIEQYPNAIDLLKVSGYLYYLSNDTFYHDPRLGLKSEFISKEKVKILKKEFIPNVYDYIRTSNEIDVISFEDRFSLDLNIF